MHPEARRFVEAPGGAVAALGSLLLLLSLGIRLWQLDAIPTVFFHDECDNTVNAIEILQGKGRGLFGLDWKPQPALAVHQIALAIRLLGPSVMSIRLPSALLSVLALVPFYWLARRGAGPLPALLAALLLSTHPGYLHFSRSGWENVQVCLYTLLAMVAVTRAEERRSLVLWALAGFSAALAAIIYFAGRATIAFLVLYGLVAIYRARGRRVAVVRGVITMIVAFLLTVAPLMPTIWANWALFNQRTSAVLVVRELPPDYSWRDLAAKLAVNASRSARAFFDGKTNNEPRYFIVDRSFLDPLAAILLVVGAVASLWAFDVTAIWWLAWLVPFGLTQVLSTGSPNLARGIALLPIVYLFVARGMRTVESSFVARRPLARGVLVLLVTLSAVRGVRDYFTWARSPELAAALQPAVEHSDFQEWWIFQNRWIAQNRGFFNVGMWLARDRSTAPPPIPAGGARSEAAPPEGRVYYGSTESRPYVIDLGRITLREGGLEAVVSAVPGADCVYDYLEAVGTDGLHVRVEAEDPRYTTGDVPVAVHLPDGHWWLQDYGAFSGGKGLVALKSERPPSLVTRVTLAPGTYDVLLGSFTGDPANGPFAIRVSLRESTTEPGSARSPPPDLGRPMPTPGDNMAETALRGMFPIPHALLSIGELLYGAMGGDLRLLRGSLVVVLICIGVTQVSRKAPKLRGRLVLVAGFSLLVFSAASFATQQIVPAVVAAIASGILLVDAVESTPAAPRRPQLWALLPLLLGAFLRFHAIDDVPVGYAEHSAALHADLSIPYHDALRSALETRDWQSLRPIAQSVVDNQGGGDALVSAIGFALFGIGLTTSRLMAAVLGTLTIAIAYAFATRLLSWRTGLFFALLLAAAPWHVAISRYSDCEHVLCPLQVLLVLYLFWRALEEGRLRHYVLCAVVLASGWFLYAPTQVLPLIVFAFLGYRIFVRRRSLRADLWKVAVFAVLFAALSAAPVAHFVRHGRTVPIRSSYADAPGYRFFEPSRNWAMAKAELRQLFLEARDPWFSKPGGGLGLTETALLIPGLVWCLRAIRSGNGRDPAILMLISLPLSFAPAMLAPDESFRRLFFTATLALLLAGIVIDRITESLQAIGLGGRGMTAMVALFTFLYVSVNAHVYFRLVHVSESESHTYHREMALFLKRNIARSFVYVVLPSEDAFRDHHRYIHLAAYEELEAERRKGGDAAGAYELLTPENLSKALSSPRNIGGRSIILAEQHLVDGQVNGPDVRREVLARFPVVVERHHLDQLGRIAFTSWEIGVPSETES